MNSSIKLDDNLFNSDYSVCDKLNEILPKNKDANHNKQRLRTENDLIKAIENCDQQKDKIEIKLNEEVQLKHKKIETGINQVIEIDSDITRIKMHVDSARRRLNDSKT